MLSLYLVIPPLTLWILTSIFILKKASGVARMPLACWNLELQKRLKDEWKPFVRTADGKSPTPTMTNILLRSFLLGPFQLWSTISLILFAGLAATVLSKPGTAAVARWVSRSILRILNISVRQTGMRASSFEAPLLVANHVSAFDILALLSLGGCFVAKEGARNLVGVGRVATAIGCIYVGRDSAESRASAKAEIVNTLRNKLSNESERNNPLVIFPEGTTTNGRGLIEFRRGAFEAGVPFQPVRLDYSNLEYSMAMLDALDHLCYLCILPGCELTVNYLAVIRPLESETPDQSAAKCRSSMMNGTGLLSFGFQTHRDERELVAALTDRSHRKWMEARKST